MKLKKQVKEEGEHEVNITVTIAKCSPSVEKDPDPKKADIIQVQNYFHCEYKLLPDDKEIISTDVVTFGDAAKLYADNDSKVLRVWLEGACTWVAWSNSRRIRVTHDALLKMFKHKCELKFWDTKDKVSAKARFDRPKAFRLPSTKAPDEIDLENVRSLLQLEGKINRVLGMGSCQQLDTKGTSKFHGAGVISQSTIAPEQSNVSTGNGDAAKTSDHTNSTTSSNNFISTTDSRLEVKVRLDKNKQPAFKNLMSLASSGAKPLPVDTEELDVPVEVNSKQQDFSNSKLKNKRKKSKDADTYASLMGKDYMSATEKIYQNGLSSVSVSLKNLFTSSRSISNCLKKRVGSVEELIIILTLDTPLLSDVQADNLNPMTLTVGSASQMPDNGMTYKELATKCIPPFIRYQFHDSPEFVSTKKLHQKNLNFNEYDVILLGTMSKALLQEYLLGPPLKIEIHDRDPKESLNEKAGIFGSQPDDDQISNVTYTTNHIKNNGFDKSYNISYGVAEFDLSELLRGERILTLISPITNFSKSSVDGNRNCGTNSVSKTKGFGIPPGDYLGNGSELKIKIQLSRSLAKNLSKNSNVCGVAKTVSDKSPECPFNRMVYIFDYENRSFLKKIITEINEINATALNLLSYPPQVIAAALSTYKLTERQKEDKSLDIITGCQIIDGEYHMFIVEGIADLGIRRLWDKLEHPEFNEDSFFRLLYNSGMSFSERIYLSLDVDLTRVRLHQPLAAIVRQPLLYVRDILPNNCFQAVTKLYQLTQCTSLHNAIRNEMLPNAEMIISLAKEFGIPLTDDDSHEKAAEVTHIKDAVTEPPPDSSTKPALPEPKAKARSIRQDMDNKMYEKVLTEREQEDPKDFIASNIKTLLNISRARAKQPSVSCDDIAVAHNYSTQTLNSTEKAKEKVREILAADPESRFTYCQKYNSATVVPVSVEKALKEKLQLSKSDWKTDNGFIFPGFKSSLESNKHSKQIDEARKQELEMPWRENILHRNYVRPCVDRLLFKWQDRVLDFDTWSCPPKFFGGDPAPVTIHAAGDRLLNEKLMAKAKDEQKWRESLVVDDSRFHSHRCLMATELTDQGAKSSNQQDRLVDILKSEPKKFSLSKPGLALSPIPALSVVSNPKVDSKHLQADDGDDILVKNVGFHPGEVDGMSWLRDSNTIPIYDYKHSSFEKTKGKDFRLVHTDREKALTKIKPLDPIEKDNHLFLLA